VALINKAEANGKPGIDDDNNGFIDDSKLVGTLLEADNNPQDYHGHGTFVRPLLRPILDNKERHCRHGATVQIMPVRVLGCEWTRQSNVYSTVLKKYAVNNGAKVINFSMAVMVIIP
jgi:subtilisin family serine protease